MAVNKLSTSKRVQMLAMLCEGTSMRAVARVCDVSMNAVVKLLADAGDACLKLHDETVQNVDAKRVQCDEVWSFCYSKQKNVKTAKAAPEIAGDVWTWTAIDADSKLIISYLVWDRSATSAAFLMDDLSKRVISRMQLTTDGHAAYMTAVPDTFGDDIDFAQLVKVYGGGGMNQTAAETRYSPAQYKHSVKTPRIGDPDERHIWTSYIERSNLTLRMHNRRFTRLTNAFSKRFESHVRMVAIYTMMYNFLRLHKSLRVTPAMQAGITDHVWTWEDVIARIDADAPKPGPRGPYKKPST